MLQAVHSLLLLLLTLVIAQSRDIFITTTAIISNGLGKAADYNVF